MKKAELVALLEAVSVEELKNAIPLKEKLEKLETRRRRLEKELDSVVKQIESVGLPKAATSPARARTKGVRKGKRRRVAQPSLSSLVVDILKEKKKPLKINDICEALLEEKKYQTRAKDFKAQVRVTMYRNDKGLFSKPKPGLFKLATDVRPKKTRSKRKTKKKAAKKTRKKTTKKVTKKKTKKKTKKRARK